MSSYAEFLQESKLLSSFAKDLQEEKGFPITVPHSRPRGTWGQWMREITIPQDVLDSIVRRYDSKSWSATGGRSSSAPSDNGVRTTPAAGAWRKKPALPRDVSKEGGAMRGVGGAATRARPKISGRARALRLRSEEYQRPGETGKLPLSLPACKHESHVIEYSTSKTKSVTTNSDWAPVSASLPRCGAKKLAASSVCRRNDSLQHGQKSWKVFGKEVQKVEKDEETKENPYLIDLGCCEQEEEVDVEVIVEEEVSEESDFQSAEETLGSKRDLCVKACEDGDGEEEEGKVMGGGEGDSVMRRGEGDSVMGGSEGDSVMGRGEGDSVMGRSEGDSVMGGSEGDSVMRGGGDSVMGGGEGDSVMRGGGDSVMGGGEGDSVVGGSDGDSVVIRGSDSDSVVGGGDGDLVIAREGRDGEVESEESEESEETGTEESDKEQDVMTPDKHVSCGVKRLTSTLLSSYTISEETVKGIERDIHVTEDCSGQGSVAEEEEEEKDVVRMKCGCTLDSLDLHSSSMGVRSHYSSMCGGRVDPEVPPWANDDHTLVFSNIPISVSEEELEEVVLTFGDVSNVVILTTPNEAGLHTAYVRMKERENCQWVISCFHGIPYDGGSEPMACYYAAT